jgi:signal transduction histidine kinase
MARAPVGKVGRALRLTAGRSQYTVLRLVPLHGRIVHVVPRELVQDEQRRQPPQLVERRPERMDVMQDPAGDDRIEGAVVVQLFQRDAAVQRARRRVGIDGEDVVAFPREVGGDAALTPAAHLEHTPGWRRELSSGVGGEVHAVAGGLEHTSSVDRSPSGTHAADERLRHLQAVTDVALAHLSLDGLLDELLLRIREALRADTAAFLLLDETGEELAARAAKGIEEEVERGVRIPMGKGFAGRIAADRRPVVLDDVDHADVLNPILRQTGIKSMLGVPLITHGKVLGVLHVGTLKPRTFTDEDVELLEIVAQRAAVAIDRALAYEQVVRLTQLQRDFIALAAHELRTPATTVYGIAATLARRELPEATAAELLETLYQQAERMSRLVEQLLDMSRLDAASIQVTPELLTLRPALNEIVRGSAPGRERDVVVETPQTEKVVADRAVLERVVGNLVTNALRYGAPPVHVVAKQTDTHLRIVVSDQGEGIEPQFIPFLFDRFQRSDRSRSRNTGAGLGLAIARAYARAHGGDLLYHPTGDGGALFELVLPRTSPPPE